MAGESFEEAQDGNPVVYLRVKLIGAVGDSRTSVRHFCDYGNICAMLTRLFFISNGVRNDGVCLSVCVFPPLRRRQSPGEGEERTVEKDA